MGSAQEKASQAETTRAKALVGTCLVGVGIAVSGQNRAESEGEGWAVTCAGHTAASRPKRALWVSSQGREAARRTSCHFHLE